MSAHTPGPQAAGHAPQPHPAPPEHAAAHQAGDAGPRAPWTVLVLMLAAQFMVVLDVSVVNIALPSIGRSLEMSAGDYQWAISAYVLLSGGLLLFGGRLADLFDRRRVFLTGLSLFTLSSLASGLAGTPAVLIAARAGQGTGAALLTPAAMAILVNSYAGRQRATALALWGAVASTGVAVGVLFGGALTSLFDWRAVFFINVPVGVAVVAATLRTVRRAGVPSARGRLDAGGALTLVSGLVLLVLAVESTRTHGWTDARTVLPAVAAAALLAVFAAVERRVAQPLVPGHVWRIRSLISASTVMLGVTGAVVGVGFLTSLFLQQVLGSSAIVAGLQFLPLAAAITASAALAARLLPHTGARHLIMAGLLVAAAGAGLLAQLDSESGYLSGVLPGFLVFGAGVGAMFAAISVAAMGGVRAEEAGLASGLMMTGHEIGAALGVATLAAAAGDLTTRSGLVDGLPTASWVIVAAMLVLLVPAAFLPRDAAPAAGGHGPHGGHLHGVHGH